MQDKLIKVSKYFSYLLRHKPETIDLQLDENGWASIQELINKTKDFELTRDLVEIVVETNDKQRFCISDDGNSIRANQGHSIEIDLGLPAQEPPSVLLHGTATRFFDSIISKGLSKQKRHHVHLTESLAVAKSVGSRFGKPVILSIAAKQMFAEGYLFYKTANNVWLVDNVPIEFIAQK